MPGDIANWKKRELFSLGVAIPGHAWTGLIDLAREEGISLNTSM